MASPRKVFARGSQSSRWNPSATKKAAFPPLSGCSGFRRYSAIFLRSTLAKCAFGSFIYHVLSGISLPPPLPYSDWITKLSLLEVVVTSMPESLQSSGLRKLTRHLLFVHQLSPPSETHLPSLGLARKRVQRRVTLCYFVGSSQVKI